MEQAKWAEAYSPAVPEPQAGRERQPTFSGAPPGATCWAVWSPAEGRPPRQACGPWRGWGALSGSSRLSDPPHTNPTAAAGPQRVSTSAQSSGQPARGATREPRSGQRGGQRGNEGESEETKGDLTCKSLFLIVF